MSNKVQVNFRISEATRTKLEQLAQTHGTMTEALVIAVDRLHQQEMKVIDPVAEGYDQYPN